MGCVIINSSLLLGLHGVDLKAHEAAPSKCVEECRAKYQYALIQRKTCICTNDNSTLQEVNESRCSVRCWSNSSLICGGEQVFSAYRTGKNIGINKYLNSPFPQLGFSEPMKPNNETNNADEHNMVKNPNWREADQLAIYKHG